MSTVIHLFCRPLCLNVPMIQAFNSIPSVYFPYNTHDNNIKPVMLGKGDSSVFVLSRTGHFGYSSIHNSVNIIGRTFMLHLHGSCHICVSMCDQHFFVNNFNWLIYP